MPSLELMAKQISYQAAVDTQKGQPTASGNKTKENYIRGKGGCFACRS